MGLQRAPNLKYLKRKSETDKFVVREVVARKVESKCFDCGNDLDAMMDNGDGKTRCVKCSVGKYKADNPVTWNFGVPNIPIEIAS